MRREVRPDALQGVSILLPPPTDERRSPGIGCGFVAQDLALRTEKAIVASLGDAGATLRNRGTAEYTLTVVLRDAVMGAENEGARRTDQPILDQPPDVPSLAQPQASPFNSGNGRAQVVLDASLARGQSVVWAGSVTGYARSAPCMRAMDTVREALGDAVSVLREDVIRSIALRGR